MTLHDQSERNGSKRAERMAFGPSSTVLGEKRMNIQRRLTAPEIIQRAEAAERRARWVGFALLFGVVAVAILLGAAR